MKVLIGEAKVATCKSGFCRFLVLFEENIKIWQNVNIFELTKFILLIGTETAQSVENFGKSQCISLQPVFLFEAV